MKSQARKDGSAPKVTTTYGYDKMNRLTSSAGPSSNTYKYDKAGASPLTRVGVDHQRLPLAERDHVHPVAAANATEPLRPVA